MRITSGRRISRAGFAQGIACASITGTLFDWETTVVDAQASVAVRMIPQLFRIISSGVAGYATLKEAFGDAGEVAHLFENAVTLASGVFLTKNPSTDTTGRFASLISTTQSLSTRGDVPQAAIDQLNNVLHLSVRSQLDYQTLATGRAAPIGFTTASLPFIEDVKHPTSASKLHSVKVYIFAIRCDGDGFQNHIQPTVAKRQAYEKQTGVTHMGDPTTAPTIEALIGKVLGAYGSVRNPRNPPILLGALSDQAIHLSRQTASSILVYDSDVTQITSLSEVLRAAWQDKTNPGYTEATSLHLQEAHDLAIHGRLAYRSMRRGYFSLVYKCLIPLPNLSNSAVAPTAVNVYVVRQDSSFADRFPELRAALG